MGDNEPNNILIVDQTGCGKTYHLLSMLENEYFQHFKYIYLICPTFNVNKTYRNWKYIFDPNLSVVQCNHDEVNIWLKIITIDSYGDPTLIILDDCAAGQSIKDRTNELVNLGFSARHRTISVFVITQQLTSIAKPFRENISTLICFYNPNKNDMQNLFNDYLGEISKVEQVKIWKKLRNDRYARLEISLRFPFEYNVKIKE